MFDFANFRAVDSALPPTAAAFCKRNDILVSNPSGLISVAELLDSPMLIERAIEALDMAQNFADETLAKAQFYKGFVKQIIAPYLCHAVYDAPVPTRLEALYLALDNDAICGVYWQATDAKALDEATLQEKINHFASAIVEVFADDIDYGKTDAWGSMGLAVANPWMSLAGTSLSSSAIISSYERFMLGLVPDLQSAMQALPVQDATHDLVLFRRRKSCCLKYQIPGKTNCKTCSKIAAATQIQQLLVN